MSEPTLGELESHLACARETVATLTLRNAELSQKLSDAELVIKRLRRTMRRDEDSHQEQLSAARTRRG